MFPQKVLYHQSEQQEVAAAPLKHKLQQLLLNPASECVSTVCVSYQVSMMLHSQGSFTRFMQSIFTRQKMKGNIYITTCAYVDI